MFVPQGHAAPESTLLTQACVFSPPVVVVVGGVRFQMKLPLIVTCEHALMQSISAPLTVVVPLFPALATVASKILFVIV